MFLRQTKTLTETFIRRMAHANLSTRLVCISDTHSHHDFPLPDGDILIHAGDLTRRGSGVELENVLSWLKLLTKFRWKIIIAGNHDVTLDQTFYEKSWRRFHTRKEDTQPIVDMFTDPLLREKYGIIYLQDQTFIDPQSQLKFYGRCVFDQMNIEFVESDLVFLVHGNRNSVRGHSMFNVKVKECVQYGIKFH